MEFRDYYDILGVSRGASQDEIKKAFRQQSRKYHPDVSTEENAEDKFKQVGEAYEVLKDPDTRNRYDMLGANYKHGQTVNPPPGWQGFDFGQGGGGGFGGAGAGPGAGSGAFSDFFEAFFGRSGARSNFWGNNQPEHGQDHELEWHVSVEEVYSCSTCKVGVNVGGKTKSYDVKIPRGTTEGSRVRLPKLGTKGRGGGRDGDLLLHVKFARHARFDVDGFNLQVDLPISAWEAALGAKVNFEIVDGEIILTVPPGAQSGQQLRLKGKGLPTIGDSNGNMLVTLKIVNPPALTEQERTAFEKLRDASTFDPRTP